MPSLNKISKNNTKVVANADGSVSVTLHNTEIIRHWPADRKLRLDTGGWFTVTTARRMNQAFNEWNLPVNVSFAKTGNAAVTMDGAVHRFSKDHICYVNY